MWPKFLLLPLNVFISVVLLVYYTYSLLLLLLFVSDNNRQSWHGRHFTALFVYVIVNWVSFPRPLCPHRMNCHAFLTRLMFVFASEKNSEQSLFICCCLFLRFQLTIAFDVNSVLLHFNTAFHCSLECCASNDVAYPRSMSHHKSPFTVFLFLLWFWF